MRARHMALENSEHACCDGAPRPRGDMLTCNGDGAKRVVRCEESK